MASSAQNNRATFTEEVSWMRAITASIQRRYRLLLKKENKKLQWKTLSMCLRELPAV